MNKTIEILNAKETEKYKQIDIDNPTVWQRLTLAYQLLAQVPIPTETK